MELYFFPVNYNQTNNCVYLYGLVREHNKPVCLRINNVNYTLFISLPDNFRKQYIENDIIEESKLFKILSKICKIDQVKLIKQYSIIGVKLDENGNRKHSDYLMIRVNSLMASRGIEFTLKKGINIDETLFKFDVHMNWIPLWYQFFLYQNIKVSSWIKIEKAFVVSKPRSIFEFEYQTSREHVFNSDIKITIPVVDVMAFDIETYCSVEGKFPNANISDDVIFMISMIYKKNITLIVLGDGNLIDQNKLQERWKDFDLKVYECKSETLLIDCFVKIFLEFKPLIVCGYNNMGFDWPYIVNRSSGFANCWSCIENLSFNLFNKAEKREIKWSSSAFMNQNFVYLKGEGISHIDLLVLIRYDYKLETYSLNSVSSYFLKKTKDEMEHSDLRLAYLNRNNDKLMYTKVGEYCIQDSLLVIDLLEKLKLVPALIALSNVTNSSIEDLVVRGTTHKITNTIIRECVDSGVMFEKKKNVNQVSFRGATVFNPILGLHTNLVSFDFASLYPNIIRTYNLCCSTLVSDDLVIPDSDCWVFEWEDHVGCIHDEELKVKKMINEREKMNKLLLKSKNMDMNNWVLYFKSRQEKEKQDEYKVNKIYCGKRYFRWYKKYDGVLPQLLTKVLKARDDVKIEMKLKNGELEKIEQEFKTNANNLELKMKIDDLKLYIGSLNALQLAYKRVANGTYGYTGTTMSMIATIEIAACTTYKGRSIIQEASSIINQKFGGLLVYGDTDSNYIKFPNDVVENFIRDNYSDYKNHLEKKIAKKLNDGLNYKICEVYERLWFFSKRVSNIVSQHFPKFLRLEFEDKIYAYWFIVNKKKYGYFTLNEDGQISKKMEAKGLVTVKRDTCAFTRIIYENVMNMVCFGNSLDNIIDYVFDKFLELIYNKISYQDLYFTKSIGDWGNCNTSVDDSGNNIMGDYVVKIKKAKISIENSDSMNKALQISSLPAHVQLGIKMNKQGENIVPGQRLKYVVVDVDSFSKSMNNKLLTLEYAETNRDVVRIDFLYYINLTCRSIDSILNIIYPYEIPDSRVGVFEKSFQKLNTFTRRLCFSLIESFDKNRAEGPTNILVVQMINKHEMHQELKKKFGLNFI